MSDVDNKVKMIVEGLLLAAGRPLTLDNIIQVFSKEEQPDSKELNLVMDSISEDCADRGFELKEVASGFRFQVKQELSEWVAKLWEERPPRYTRALLETLALVAYRQPITRGDIEEIRGVGVSSNIVRTLLDREWIRVVGHRDVPGRPAMFATTKQFLDYFNLKSLQDLPPLSEVKDLAVADPQFDLEDDLAAQRILELPEEVIDENSVELSESDKTDLIAEEEAVALSKKPLDEILKLPPELQYPTVEDEEDEEPDAEDVEFEEEFGIKALDEALDSLEAVDIKITESESESESESEPEPESAEGDGDASQEESTEIEFSVNDDDADTKIQH
ncbi:MAG: SMC-Scp complex subunit ScpB [SAR86 cluster bacterium]|uniref:SMC-Scp complex subunit ScpB n=1 Tax=SAR86 cluster bacterium TaxID=2030880 RepID=A0A2A4XCP4_9GAMM|nr:MAG: SMC-Scp complex subunit ScpB [SAR86 cluster bacterium]